ncbi:hypothetical protein [Kocuria oceani]|uniref:GerMN domain-containing protein n=1 Tax=Kocuria oceani TaxID=988827 RepID=A0ABV9TGU4_9MICC|nr:hypothetical protein [Kocuria oceani]
MRVLKYLGNVLVVAVAVVLILVALLIGLKAFGLSDPALEAVGITTQQPQATSNDENATQAADPPEQGRAEPSDAATLPEAVPTPMPTPEAVPTPETNPEAVASPAEPVDPVTATEAVNRYLAAEPWYGPQEMGTSIVDTVVVEGDDVIVTFVTDLETNATKTYAPSVLTDVTSALRAHPDDPALQSLDLVAIYTQDGGMATYETLWR